ncbi:TetR/AcrR family transcriptional regulator [Sandaracinus amylolyticus]|uniref:TetR/AcrR family transcriptional regulator n=1 Tax=Sandaracinus amylolyticus TaxID=927083 RepID=UPI001F332F7B|nr:TetR/AcrR family transcriptional regulator [Sandaracinus amylolyticus]
MERTHRALREALFAAMRERGFDAVSVQAICARANVGRSTFYAHFADKEDLLVSGFDELREQLRAHVAVEGAGTLRFVRPLLAHVREHWWIPRSLGAGRAGLVVRERLLEVIEDLVRDDLRARGASEELAVRYLAGAFSETVRFWLESERPIEVEEVARRFDEMSRPVLESLRCRSGRAREVVRLPRAVDAHDADATAPRRALRIAFARRAGLGARRAVGHADPLRRLGQRPDALAERRTAAVTLALGIGALEEARALAFARRAGRIEGRGALGRRGLGRRGLGRRGLGRRGPLLAARRVLGRRWSGRGGAAARGEQDEPHERSPHRVMIAARRYEFRSAGRARGITPPASGSAPPLALAAIVAKRALHAGARCLRLHA